MAAVALSACAGGELPPSAFPGVAVEGNAAYLASNTHLNKYDLQTGAVIWQFPASQENNNPRGPFSGMPVKLGDAIIIGGSAGLNGGYDKNLYAVSDATGAELWRFTGATREYVDGVVTDGKIIYAPSGDGYLYALDPSQKESSGEPKLVWKFGTGNRLWGRPLLADGRLYQGSFDHKMYAIDAATGKELWRFEGATAAIAVQPALDKGVLYFGSFDSNLYAITAADGKLKWKTQVNGWVWCNPTVYQNMVYAADVTGRVYALDAETGQQKWFYDTRDTVRGDLIIDNGVLYAVSMDTYVYALDAAGEKRDASGKVEYSAARWRNETLGRRLVSEPAIHGDDLIVPLLDGDIKIWSLDKNTGARKMQFPPTPGGTPAPAK